MNKIRIKKNKLKIKKKNELKPYAMRPVKNYFNFNYNDYRTKEIINYQNPRK